MTSTTDQSAAVLDAIERRRSEAIELLSSLIKVNSTNPSFPGVETETVQDGESRCTEMLEKAYAGAGCVTHRVAEDPARANLVAVRVGRGAGRSLLLNGHVDTVPPMAASEWCIPSPWSPEIRDGRMYGLGATDMKGGLVAGWLAAQAIEDANITLQGDLVVQCVVGEESWEHDLGTSACVSAGFTADAAIVLEPTSLPRPLTVCVVSAGLWALKITVPGRSTHAGNRPLAIRPGGPGDAIGVNALEKGIKVVEAIRQLEDEWGLTKNHPLFPPGFFTLLPGVFYSDAGYPLPYFFPDHAEIHYDVFHDPRDSGETCAQEVEEFVRAMCAMDTWLRHKPPTFDWVNHYPALDTPADHPLAQTLRDAHERANGVRVEAPSRQNPANFAAVMDGSWLQQAGIPAIAFGPGDITVAHCKDESVVIEEILEAARALSLTILRWCGSEGSA